MTPEQRRKKLVDNKAFRKGEMFGIEFSLYVMAWVMVEELKEDSDKVQDILNKMEDFCIDFGKGNISLRDMQEVLRDEHSITIQFGRKKGGDYENRSD